MSKIIVIGKNGTLTNVRNEKTDEAIQKYCEEKNITVEEFKKSKLSIYTIDFPGGELPISFITA